MLTVTIDQSEGISGADIPEQAVKKMRTGSAALSLPSPRAFFAFLFTERLFTTISKPGTGYVFSALWYNLEHNNSACPRLSLPVPNPGNSFC